MLLREERNFRTKAEKQSRALGEKNAKQGEKTKLCSSILEIILCYNHGKNPRGFYRKRKMGNNKP